MLARYLNSLHVRDWIALFAVCIVLGFSAVFGVSYVAGSGWPVLDLASEIALSVLCTVFFAIVLMLIDAGLAKCVANSLNRKAGTEAPAKTELEEIRAADNAEDSPTEETSNVETGFAIPRRRFGWLYRFTPQWNVRSVALFSAVMAIFWLPWLIANFPGSTYWDTYYQIFQVYPENHPIAIIPWAEIYNQTLTDAWLVDHHPIFTTLVYGAFGWLSDQLTGNWMAGVFTFVCIQGIAHVVAFTASAAYFRKVGCPIGFAFAIYVFFCIMPFVSTWALCMVKDSFFGLFFIPYIMMLFEALRTQGRMLMRPRNIALLSLCALMLCLTKKTGTFVVIPTAVVMAIFFAIRLKAAKGAAVDAVIQNAATPTDFAESNVNSMQTGLTQTGMAADDDSDEPVSRACIVVASLMPAVVSIAVVCILFPMTLFPALNIIPGGKQEVLGPLFQQTARYIVDYPEDVTPEEAQTILKVLDYDKLAENYNFDFEDSVKYRFNLKATDEDLLAYLDVYIKHGLRHPDSYFGAFMGLAGFYVAPTAYANIRMVTVDTKMGPDNRYMLWNPDELDWMRNGMDDAYSAIGEIPGVNIPLLLVTYDFWIPAALLFFMLRRRVKAGVLFVPFAVLIGFCIIAPVYDARYVVPIFDGIPLLVCAVITLTKYQTQLVLRARKPDAGISASNQSPHKNRNGA